MGSARFKMVADSLSGGLDLFIGQEVERERTRIDQQWAMALEDMREGRMQAREDRAAAERDKDRASADARYAESQETSRAATAATAQFRSDTLTQNAEQFDKRMAADEDKALRVRLNDLEDRAAEALELTYGDIEKETQIKNNLGNQRDQAIANHVIRMASANDGKGAPGYTNIKGPDDLASKMIQMELDPAGADQFAKELAPRLWPDLIPESTNMDEIYKGGGVDAGGQTRDQRMNRIDQLEADQAALQAPPSPTQPGAPGGSAAAASVPNPVDMIGDPGTIPPANQQRPGYHNPDQRGSLTNDLLFPAGRGIKDWLESGAQPNNPSPYATMGQRPK